MVDRYTIPHACNDNYAEQRQLDAVALKKYLDKVKSSIRYEIGNCSFTLPQAVKNYFCIQKTFLGV